MVQSLSFGASVACLLISFSVSPVHAKGSQPFVPGQAPAATKPVSLPNPEGAAELATQQALRETQEALNDPTKRAAMIKGDAKAEAFDAKVRGQLGDQTDGAYQISAQIMEKLVQESGGDAAKMQEIVGKLMANPQSLEKYLSPADRAKISEMAGKIENKRGHAPASQGN